MRLPLLIETGLIALFLLPPLLFDQASGAVIYDSTIRSVFAGGAGGTNTLGIDLNSDGNSDLIFQASLTSFAFTVRGPSTTSLVHDTRTSAAAVLGEGSIICMFDPSSDFTLLSLSMGGGLLSFAFDDGGIVTGGPFLGQIAYLGFEFEADDGNHFGYILIREQGGFGGFFLETGYESEPGVPIIAGAVPEPSGTLLICLGSMLGLIRRSRNWISSAIRQVSGSGAT